MSCLAEVGGQEGEWDISESKFSTSLHVSFSIIVPAGGNGYAAEVTA